MQRLLCVFSPITKGEALDILHSCLLGVRDAAIHFMSLTRRVHWQLTWRNGSACVEQALAGYCIKETQKSPPSTRMLSRAPTATSRLRTGYKAQKRRQTKRGPSEIPALLNSLRSVATNLASCFPKYQDIPPASAKLEKHVCSVFQSTSA